VAGALATARWLRMAVAALTIVWLAGISVPYVHAAWRALGSAQFLGCAQATTTVIAAALVAVVGLLVGALAPLRARMLFLRGMFALAGLAAAFIAVRSGAAWPMLAAIWVLLLGWAAGARVLRLLVGDPDQDGGSVRAALAIAVGFGLTSHLGLLLAVTGMLHLWLLVTVLLAGTMLLRRDLLAELQAVADAFVRGTEGLAGARRAWFGVGIGAYLAFFSLLVLVQAIAPEIQYDSLNYHLTVPRIFIEHHRLIAVPWIMQSWLAAGTEMTYLLAMLLAGQTAAKLVNFAFLVVAFALVHAFTKRFIAPAAALPAAALFVTAPFVAWEGATTYTDLPLATLGLATFTAVSFWLEERRTGWLVLAGVLAGLALSCKLNAILMLAPLAVAVAVISLLRRDTPLRARVAPVLVFTAAAIPTALPWPLVRLMQTGNPVFPFLNGIFKSPLWPAVNTRFNLGSFGIGTSVSALVRLPWAVSFDAMKFGEAVPPGVLGIAPLALPLLLLVRRWARPAVLATTTVAAFALAWAYSAQYLRYSILGLPLAYALLGSVIVNLDEERSGWPGRAAAGLSRVAVIVWMVAALPLWLVLYWPIPERMPYAVALGNEPRASYLTRTVASYAAYQYLNATHPSAGVHVVSVGDEFGFYAEGKVESLVTSSALRPLVTASSAREVMDFVRREGISHLLVNRRSVPPGLDLIPLLSPAFLDANAAIEFARRGVVLYRFLSPEEVASHAAAPPPAELLVDAGFEERRGSGPAGWAPFGSPGYGSTSEASHGGTGAVRVSTAAGFTQALKVTGGVTYVLSHFSRAASPDCSVRAQVNWLDRTGRIADVSISVWPCTNRWTWHELPGTAPDDAVTAVVFANAQKGEAWLDDYSFVAVGSGALARMQ
jgi:hypothetical protein